MADTEKANEGAAKAKGAEAPKAGSTKPETTTAPAKAADAGGNGGLTQADLDKAVADAVADRNAEIDKLKADHATDLEQKIAAAEEKGYKNGVKDGGDAAVPSGSAIYSDKQIEALKTEAHKEGVQEGLDSYEADPDDEIAFRGQLMEILLLIPANLRRIRPEDRLRDMVDFLDVLRPMERALAVPMIRSIALMEPNDIPNGKYKADVLNALNVVENGNSLDVMATEDSLDTNKAFARLQSVVATNAMPAGAAFESGGQDRPDMAGVSMDANDPQAAGQRLAFLTGGVVQQRPGSNAKFEDGLSPE